MVGYCVNNISVIPSFSHRQNKNSPIIILCVTVMCEFYVYTRRRKSIVDAHQLPPRKMIRVVVHRLPPIKTIQVVAHQWTPVRKTRNQRVAVHLSLRNLLPKRYVLCSLGLSFNSSVFLLFLFLLTGYRIYIRCKMTTGTLFWDRCLDRSFFLWMRYHNRFRRMWMTFFWKRRKNA